MKKGKKATFGPTGSWFMMPRELTLSSALNPYQYRILSILVERDNKHQSTEGKKRFWCYNDWLVSHSGMGRTKTKETLNELEKMGFISISRRRSKRQANVFQVNWDYINSYQAPKTKYDEWEEMEEPDIQEEVPSVSVPTPTENYDKDVSVEEAEQYQECQNTTIQDSSTPLVQSPTMEWYQSVEPVLFERYFPEIQLHKRSKDDEAFNRTVQNLTDWIEAELPGCDLQDVIDNYVGPGYVKFKKQMRDAKQIQ